MKELSCLSTRAVYSVSSRALYALRSASSRATCTPHHLTLHTLCIKSRRPRTASSRTLYPLDFCLRRWAREQRITEALPAFPAPRGNRQTRPMIPARLRRDRLDFRLFTFNYSSLPFPPPLFLTLGLGQLAGLWVVY